MMRAAPAALIVEFSAMNDTHPPKTFFPVWLRCLALTSAVALVLNLGLTRHVRDLSDRRDQVQAAITDARGRLSCG